MTSTTTNKKLTPTYSSSLIRNYEYGGLPVGSPEAKAAIQRVKAHMKSTRRKGNRDTVLTLPIMEMKGGK